MSEIQFGSVAGSVLLSLFLSWLWTLIAKDGNPESVDNRLKKGVAVIAGILLGIVGMYYAAYTDPKMVVNFVTWVNYVIAGFMIGCTAIGLNQLTKGGK